MIKEKRLKLERAKKRKLRVRKKIFGTKDRPRLAVSKSLKHVYAQIIDDTEGKTIVFVSTLTPGLNLNGTKTWTIEAAKKVGYELGKRAIEKGIKKVQFDRSSFKFHGRIKAIADGAREAGLEF